MKSALWFVAICLLASAPIQAQSPADPAPVAEATPTPTAVPTPGGGQVLYPVNGPSAKPASTRGTPAEPPAMPGLAASFLVLLALCAGGFYLLRRQTGFLPVGKGQRKLLVSESRSLGNRQFLVVVEYESERLLLGVTPGKIDYLCPLPFKEQMP